VILACHNAEIAVQMIGALNPKRYRVEHIHDLSEALLRAEIVLAHALVVHSEDPDAALAHRCRNTAQRVTTVIVSRSRDGQMVAAELAGRYVPVPFEIPDFKRAVYRAVSRTEDRRQRGRPDARDSHLRSVQRVIVLTSVQVKGAVMGAVLQDQLSVRCDVATTAGDALSLMQAHVDAMVAEPELLMEDPDGAALARKLTRRGIPVIPIKQHDELDVAEAGQTAWDIVPQLRRSLTARAPGARQAG
jgi:hypothetical protein